jgi:ABC-type transport system involved in multi-copper enzyme maturation permease subunit
VLIGSSILTKSTKRSPASGAMLGFLYYIRKPKVIISIGAIVFIIGIIGVLSFGSIVLKTSSERNINPVDQRPYPINGVSPYNAELAFAFVMIAGLAIVAYGVVSFKYKRSSNKIS